MAECEYCGVDSDDPQACAECGGVYCHDHDKPLMHECDSIDGAVGDDVFDPSKGKDGLPDLSGTLVWAGVILGTVVLLIGMGVATGVVAPEAIIGSPDPPDDAPTAPPTSQGTDFDEGQFRRQVLEQIDTWRADRDLEPLETVDGRRDVANAIAEDMAAQNYFNNREVQNDTRFAPKQRLADSGFGCAEASNVLYLTAFDKPIDTESGRTRLTNTTQAADWVSKRLREELGRELWDPDVSKHSLGVYVTDDNLIYIVYIAC